MTRLLCTGDLHIGAGTDHRVDALADQERLLDQIMTVARSENVDTILIAGDVFHRPKPSPAELHVFARFTAALADAGIPAIAVLGNAGHDQYGTDQPTALELFASPWLRVSRNPELVKAAGDVAVCTLPSVQVSRLVADQGGGDRAEVNQAASDLLIETARGLRSDVPEGWPAVLLGHWSVTGASLPNGLPTDDLHEPVLPLDGLEALRFDAVVLAHIHRPQVLCVDPWIGYVGSPMCLSFGEAHTDHGCYVLEMAA